MEEEGPHRLWGGRERTCFVMSVDLSAFKNARCMSVYLCLPFCLPRCLPVCLNVCLTVCLTWCLSICLSVIRLRIIHSRVILLRIKGGEIKKDTLLPKFTTKRIELGSLGWSGFKAFWFCYKIWPTGIFWLNSFRSCDEMNLIYENFLDPICTSDKF